MLARISLDLDGGIEVHEVDAKLIVAIPSTAFVLLDFFNEGKAHFSWEGEAQRAAELLLWRLEDHDLMPKDMHEYHRQMVQLCIPGGPTGYPFLVNLVDAA